MSGNHGRVLLLGVLLLWPLAAFGGRAASTAIPLGLVCLAAALVLRPRLGGGLDRALGALVAVVALQAAPLPAAVVALASPHAATVERALALDGQAAGAFRPLTIDALNTGWAWWVVTGTVALFWIARAQFARGGVRRTVRIVAGMGFAVSLLAVAQAATAGRNIYWRFPTEFEGPLPFGPFVNRNHFATWVVMALPVCLGYLAARSTARSEPARHAHPRTRVVQSLDARSIWLIASAVTMFVALLLSLSRSGALALAVSGGVTTLLCRRRLTQRRRRHAVVTIAIVVLAGLAWADVPGLSRRVAGAPHDVANRLTIWRETLPIVRDFWLTGTGAGTYQRAMAVYQQSARTVYFNQAHNHYLQVAAEGGLLLAGILVVALARFVRRATTRLTRDTSGVFWIRAGAACGLGAVALQSVWETGLVMPANAALAAVLAALTIHERAVVDVIERSKE